MYVCIQVRCIEGKLQGATLSDNGFPIIAMFFDLPNSHELSLARELAFQVSHKRQKSTHTQTRRHVHTRTHAHAHAHEHAHAHAHAHEHAHAHAHAHAIEETRTFSGAKLHFRCTQKLKKKRTRIMHTRTRVSLNPKRMQKSDNATHTFLIRS